MPKPLTKRPMISSRQRPASTAKKPDAFPRFKDLPKEIRLMIWSLLLPGPRIVHLDAKRDDHGVVYLVYNERPTDLANPDAYTSFFYHARDSYRRDERVCGIDYGPEELWKLKISSQPLPNILTVCRESFDVISSNYTRTLGAPGTRPNFRFSSRYDTLYLCAGIRSWRPDGSRQFTIDFRGVKKLILGRHGFRLCKIPSLDADAYPQILEILSWFDDLEEVTFTDEYPRYLLNEHGIQADLVLMDFMDSEVLYKYYCEGYEPENDRALQAYQEAFSVQAAREFAYDKEELARLWRKAVRENKPAIKTLPKFYRRITTTAKLKDRFERARDWYHKMKDQHRIRLVVTSLDLGCFDIFVAGTTMVEDVVEQYRVTRGLPKDTHLALYNGRDKVEAGSRLLDMKDLSDGSILNVLSQEDEDIVDDWSEMDE